MRKAHFLLAATIMCMSTAISANAQSGSCGTSLTWTLSDDVLYINGSGDMSFTNTTSYAIYKDRIKSVVFEEGVTSIADGAFTNFTVLQNVSLSSTITDIKSKAFSGCQELKAVNLPAALLKIGANAFEKCDLHSLTVPQNVIEVGMSAFDYNANLEVVSWNCNIPRSTYLEEINGSYNKTFFANTAVRKVIFGQHVTEVPDRLFQKTKLSEVETQGTIQYVGADAFVDTPWMTQRAAEPIYVDKCLYYWPKNVNSATKIDVPEGIMGITPRVFADYNYIVEVTLPSTLEYLGSCVFANCTSLTKINYNAANLTAVTSNYYSNKYHNLLGPALAELVVGQSVKSLPKNLCKDQAGLKEISLPQVETIGEDCFYECKGLVKVDMPKVKYIDREAFYNTAIENLTLPNTLEYIGERAFEYIPPQQHIVFGPNLTTIGNDIFGFSLIDTLTFHTSLTGVESGKGRLAAQVNHIIIDDELTQMPPDIFCDGTISGGDYVAKTLVVGRSIATKPRWSSAIEADTVYWYPVEVEVINNANNADYYVSNCKKVVVGEGVKALPTKAFTSNLIEELTLPEGLESIGMYLFQHVKIKELSLPGSLKEIGKGAFSYCDSIKSVYVKWEDPRLVNAAPSTFYDKDPEAVLFVPKGTEKLYADLEPWKEFINIASDPDTWEKPQCDAPVVTFSDGSLRFTSDTEDATYHYTITDSDIKSGEVQYGELALTATYEIAVYSSAPGHINSEVTNVTLCFLRQGQAGIADIEADLRGVAVCVNGRDILVSGLDNNEEVAIYDLYGHMLDSAHAIDGQVRFAGVSTGNNIVIVKFNDDAIKVALR